MTRTKSRIASAVIALVVNAQAHAQPGGQRDDDGDGPEAREALTIKIHDLIEAAVALSPDLARAKIDRTMARAAAGAARRPQAWILSSSVQYQRNATADHVDVAPFSVVAEDKIIGALGLGRLLPTGGTLQLELGVQHANQELNIPTGLRNSLQQMGTTTTTTTGTSGQTTQPTPFEYLARAQTQARATFKQPLSRGFGPDVVLAPERKGDLAAAEATIKAQLAAEQLVKDLVTGYWELAYAAYEVDVRQQSLELANKQSQLTHEEMRAGAVPQTALNAVTYELAVRQEALLRSQMEWEARSHELRRRAGLEIGRREIVMRPGEVFELGPVLELDIDELVARSRSANRQLTALALEKKIADVDVKVATDATRPQIDVSVSGALIGAGESTGESFGALGRGDSFEVTAGLSVSFELSGAARKGRDAALAKRHKLDIDRADLERQIDTAIVASAHQVNAARLRVSLADQAITVAEENVRAERNNFLVNKTTNFQVLQRQTQLIEARLRRGRAVADYHVAVAQLQFLGGTLLDAHGVEARPHDRSE